MLGDDTITTDTVAEGAAVVVVVIVPWPPSSEMIIVSPPSVIVAAPFPAVTKTVLDAWAAAAVLVTVYSLCETR